MASKKGSRRPPPEDSIDRSALYRSLPSVEKLASHPRLMELFGSIRRDLVVDAARELLAEQREAIGKARLIQIPPDGRLVDEIVERVLRLTRTGLRTVVNATGTLLHTNLGRARVPAEVADAARAAAATTVDLEIDLASGKRGNRYKGIGRLLRTLTGAEDALAVNNNAAAVLLVIHTLARGREVVVSRGELIEIGGAFRMPEIVRAAGARLVEVGTTNRTRPSDYERAIGPDTALLLKSHTSNYRIVGFSRAPTTAELVAIGKRHQVPVYEDLGSGCLVDLRRYGLSREPTIGEVVGEGADLVSFSTDKLLGGPQGGVVVGRGTLVRSLRANDLLRALRIDKVTMAMLEKILSIYLDPPSVDRKIPFYWAIARTPEQVRDEAMGFLERLTLLELVTRVQPTETRVGGGACPTDRLASYALGIEHPELAPYELAARLRSGSRPVLGRIHDARLVLDFRTVYPEDREGLAEALTELDRSLVR